MKDQDLTLESLNEVFKKIEEHEMPKTVKIPKKLYDLLKSMSEEFEEKEDNESTND